MNDGSDEIIISERGNRNPQRLAVAAPQVSWQFSAAGAFSAWVRVNDLRAAGLWEDLKGRWLTYESEAGRWGGVITAQPTTNNAVEIVAEGHVALLRDHELVGSGMGMGTPGGLATWVLREAAVSAPTYVTTGSIDEGGEPMHLDMVGDAAFDLLPQIAETGEVEWLIDADRVFTLARRLGRDRSASLTLIEDRHIVNHQVNDDLWNASRSVARPSDLAALQAPPPPWQGVAVGIGANNPAVPSYRAQPLPTISAQLTLANVDGCFRAFDLGDTVRVELGSIGICGRFRGVVRALDVASRALTVSGELLRDD